MSKDRAFITLDALRGVAAFPVVYLHAQRMFGPDLFPHAHLAVDFFFLLSGFVMAYVYQDRLDQGWTVMDFMRVRILRLYPLYLVGIVGGTVFYLLQGSYGKSNLSFGGIAWLFCLCLLFLPAPPDPLPPKGTGELYPFDPPAWSLFFELFANLVHGIFLRRKTLKILPVYLVALAAIQLPLALHDGLINSGWGRNQYLQGALRVLFAYPFGILLYRLWSQEKGRIKVPPLVSGILLLAFLAIPLPHAVNGIYEWAAVTFVFPLLILAGATTQPRPFFVPFSQWLGGISYSIYILHDPIIRFFEQAWRHLVKHHTEQDQPISGLILLMIMIPLVHWIGKLYDPEARKFLSGRIWPASPSPKKLSASLEP